MYNGIGLTTVRGSGTNGYVQRTMAHVSRDRAARQKGATENAQSRMDALPKAPPKANAEIIEHNRRREVEVKVFALRETMEEKGIDEAEIDRSCDELRQRLLSQLPSSLPSSSSGGRAGETHAAAVQKEQENAALKAALGIPSEYVGGSAFDRELQEKKKAERIAKREAEELARQEAEAERERERARAEAELEREMRREEKRKRKEARREEKERRRKEKRRRSDSNSEDDDRRR